MQLVCYCGQAAALVGLGSVHLAPPFNRLPSTDADRRFLLAMCEFAQGVQSGEGAASYSDSVAEMWARISLIPQHDVTRRDCMSDRELAADLRVPVEQAYNRRRELNRLEPRPLRRDPHTGYWHWPSRPPRRSGAGRGAR